MLYDVSVGMRPLNGRLICLKTWDRIIEIFGSHGAAHNSLWAVWVVNYEIYAINHVLVCIRPEMAVKFEFTK